MKTKKITKKQIVAELKTLDCTRIHRIASICGVDANNSIDVIAFTEKYVGSLLLSKIIRIVRNRDIKTYSYVTEINKFYRLNESTISRIRREMNEQIKWGYSSYSKILIEGNINIYWASPVYLHSDYNKSRAMENTPKNRKVMELVNKMLAKHNIK